MTDAQWAVELVRGAAASHFSATPPNRSTPREHADTTPQRPDWVWMERWQGRFPSAFPAKGTLHTVADLRAAWASLDTGREEFLSSLTAARLDEPLAFRNMKGDAFEYPLGSLLLHVSNHATYHRGQVMQLVRQLGGTVSSTDVLFWLAEEK